MPQIPGKAAENSETEQSDSAGAYILVDYNQSHPDRAREIMNNHPEARELCGHNSWSAVWLLGLVAIQLVLGYLVTSQPWWLILLTAYFIGAFLNHGLWVLVHECTHNLIFKRRTPNRWLAIIANLPMFFPSTVTFAVFHIKHHQYLGQVNHDADLALRWEDWLFRKGFIGRLIWQILFPIMQSVRTLFISAKNKPTSWSKFVVWNFVIQIAFLCLWRWSFGPGSLIYFLLSSFFSVGPHLLGARWIQEHYVFREGQETYSYYGLLNLFQFNIGYHNEHHDLPHIPWNRLPKLKRLAPEMYEQLFAHYSWTRLWFRFLFDSKLEVIRIARR